MTAGTVTPDFQRTINVYDSQGGSQPVTFSFVKTGANTWAYEASYAGTPANLTGANPIAHRHRHLQFRRHAGECQRRRAGLGHLRPDHSVGGFHAAWRPQTVAVNLGTVGGTSGLTQFDARFDPERHLARRLALRQRHRRDGRQGRHRDGAILQRPVAGRLQDSDRHLHQSRRAGPDVAAMPISRPRQSGAANINLANTGAAGGIQPRSLEGSTVDLATEFTNLITTQRAYSASARIITTADQMLQQLEQLPTN